MHVETGTGFKTAKSQQDSSYTNSIGNNLTAKNNIILTSTDGNIHAQSSTFNAGEHIGLDSAKDILLESGKSTQNADGKHSNLGASVGVGATTGAQTGLYVYAEVGGGKGKNHLDNTFSDKKKTYFFGLPRNKGAAGVYRSTEVTVIDSDLNFNTIMYIFESKAKGIYHWALIKEKLLDGLNWFYVLLERKRWKIKFL